MKKQKIPWYYLFLLILAGESVFILPFVLPRVFRPTVLEAFNLSNVELGYCFSVYGIVALFSYLFGGPLADKFSPRKLIAVALWSTALGGIVYGMFPSYFVLKILYGYWGFTTIFLFWSPMIKATRVWGGAHSQGKAFSFLDGGRGFVGSLFAMMGVVIFSFFMTVWIEDTAVSNSQIAIQYVIFTSSGIVALVGVLIWFLMEETRQEEKILVEKISVSQIKKVLRLPSVWLLMIIILCAYIGYKVTDVLSLYAKDVMLYNTIQSAQVGTILLFIRPVIGVIIGLLADRSQTTLWLFLCFVVSFFGALLFATGIVNAGSTVLFFVSIFIVASGVYAVRCLYFAVMDAGQIPLILTGTAVGVISLVGYTPDIFAGPVIGYLLDSWPGATGHQYVVWMWAGFHLVGGCAAWRYFQLYKKKVL